MKKRNIIIISITTLIIASTLIYFSSDQIISYLSDYELTFSCSESTDKILAVDGCFESTKNEYQIINMQPPLVKSIYGEITCKGSYNAQYVDLYLLINGNWINKYTFSLIYTSYLTFDITINKNIEGFKFSHAGISYYGSNSKSKISTNGKIIINTGTTPPPLEQCDLTVYVEDYLDGQPVENHEVIIKQSGNTIQTKNTDNDGNAVFTLDYGSYNIYVDSQEKTVNLNIPTWYEKFTLNEIEEPIDLFPYILLFLLFLAIIILGLIVYYKTGKTKKK